MDKYNFYLLGSVFGAYVLLLITAAVFDATKYIIPNVIVVALAALFVLATILLPVDTDWISHAGAAASVFAVGALAYRFKALGAGDVKLLTAVSLWVGFEHLPLLLLYTALSGGALAISFVLLRRVVQAIAFEWPMSGFVVLAMVLLFGVN